MAALLAWFPVAVPTPAGLISVALAVVGAVVGEFAGGDQGLGHTLVLAERALLPWARETTG
ncbi:hypothetical protein [Streptomyces sp. cg40]|uniref:hypothetical protein n=1 Tax=Streptomyces sp. cg40 TaxID=3419764 RepID=UPI003D044905